MSQLRKVEIAEKLTRFLARFSPPTSIRDNPQAMQDETDALLRRLLHHGPANGAGQWAEKVLQACEVHMQTRAWPTVREVDRACDEQRRLHPPQAANDGVEAQMVDRLAAWFAKFGTQMPGCGNPARTQELIRRGVLKSEREARFKGFTLGSDQMDRAMAQEPTIDEQRHHDGVLFDLRATNERIERNRAARVES